MNLTRQNKRWLIACAILLFFILTNPSIKAFKDYKGLVSYEDLRRKYNFGFFSIYEDNYGYTYIAVLSNFFHLPRFGYSYTDTNPNIITDSLKVDSSAFTDTAKTTYVLPNKIPYSDRVYLALKENVSGFDTPKNVFEKKIKDKHYAINVYKALKDNLQGFDKTENQFLNSLNE